MAITSRIIISRGMILLISSDVSSFFTDDVNPYFSQHIKNWTLFGLIRASNFYIVEYCEIFEMLFGKILAFQYRGVTHQSDTFGF